MLILSSASQEPLGIDNLQDVDLVATLISAALSYIRYVRVLKVRLNVPIAWYHDVPTVLSSVPNTDCGFSNHHSLLHP